MQTPEFEQALEKLISFGSELRIQVRHIITAAEAPPHELTSFAKVAGRQVLYPSLV